jgi:hypothetical protein
MDGSDSDTTQGEVPEGVGPEVFRERLRQSAAQGATHEADILLDQNTVSLSEIDTVEEEADGQRSRVRLRSGLIIGGLTGAAIVAALATLRYRQRHAE